MRIINYRNNPLVRSTRYRASTRTRPSGPAASVGVSADREYVPSASLSAGLASALLGAPPAHHHPQRIGTRGGES